MIKANELRIGNWVIDNETSTLRKVSELINPYQRKIGFIDYGYSSNKLSLLESEVSPIPLTPEILEKCGFTEDEGIDKRYFIDDAIDFFTIQKIDDGYYLFGSEFTEGNAFNYLHQLQNLYFALYGKELNINL